MSFLLSDSPSPSSGPVTRGQHRKRVLSELDGETAEHKRPRISTRISSVFNRTLAHIPPHNLNYDRMPSISRDEPHFGTEPSASTAPLRRSRLVGASASFSYTERSFSYSDRTLSRQTSVSSSVMAEGFELIRKASISSLQDNRGAPVNPPVAESAIHHLRGGKMSIDFSVAEADAKEGVSPVSWSQQNIMVFGRGNRVHYKNIIANDDVAQLCKIREEQGSLRLVKCGGRDQPNTVAVCTSKGHIQLWDLSTKKIISHWTTKPVTAMDWNGPVLTVGGVRGTIRHFDTRIKETPKMKEQTKKVTRHQSKICSLTWNTEGKFFASGDESGVVHVWDSRQNAPLDVGELIQRRRKIQHVGPVHALAWCPWQPKLLASGDSAPDGTGTIRLWNIGASPSSLSTSIHPTKLELDAQITSLHFSAHCKELLSTHGPGKSTPAPPPSVHLESHSFPSDPIPSKIANSIVVHALPSFRQIAAVQAAHVNIAGSVLSPNGQRLVLAVPEESKLKVWDVWGKRKELRRSMSVLDGKGIR